MRATLAAEARGEVVCSACRSGISPDAMPTFLRATSVAFALVLAACDSKPTGAGADGSASPSASSAPSGSSSLAAEPAGKRPFTVMPDMVVDDTGIGVGPERIDLGASDGAMKLGETLDRVPIDGKQVTLRTTTKASIRDVGAMIAGLGKRGAPGVLLKMDGARKDLPQEYVVVPESRIEKPDDCSVAASVLEDASTAVWAFKGGGGKKARKGLSGPDLSVTGENVVAQLKGCTSKTAFFAAHPKLRWEHAFHIGGLIRKSDEAGNIDKLVFLARDPAAGQPIKLEK